MTHQHTISRTPVLPGGQVQGREGPGGRAPGRRQAPPALTARWCSDPEGFGALAPAWRRLHRACPAATPFQSHAWLYSWWQSYGRPGRLRVLVVEREGVLVAAAPLTLTHRPFPVLVPLGGEISDFADVLIDESCAREAARALADALADAARTAVIDLREVRPGGAAERLAALWRGPSRQLPDSACLELPAVSMDGLLGRLPSSTAQRFRAKLRKLDALAIESGPVTGDEVPEAVRTLLGLHRLQWQGRKVTPEHLQPRFRDHLVRSVRAMVLAGEAVLTEYRLEGEVVAVDVTLLSPSLAGGYLYGADPRLRSRKADVATMLLRTCAGYAAQGGHTTLSLLRGNEPYKHHWRPEPVANQRILLARRRTAVALWTLTGRAALRRRATAALRTHRERRAGPRQ
ncbi:GNAT family N-acetyltransferase [Streptomyces tsukubensis]|uniref:Glycosyl transferase family 1 n=1 Tax=Streptomyces tsukubensis TaxID=83656 RepID=A0A1V4A577_9ACTN|nr:GNAT family N-acetyltransferase [Streptomyces tsukubensis]OON75369.1 glycosyl transferase family 1 [Streptomyces tsukubensis]QFR95002.1 GNAT family N-acetyltransferase [Streptomyces tsukubensis]